MSWWFEKAPAITRKDQVEEIRNHIGLGPLELMVREAVQNSLDVRLENDEPVKIEIGIKTLRHAEKSAFLEAIDPDGAYLQKLKQVREVEEKRAQEKETGIRSTIHISKTTLRAFNPADGGAAMRLLYFKDANTEGLTGGERGDTDYDPTAGSNFKAFAWSQGISRKKGNRPGGSHGKGKNTLWANSIGRLVLAYSKLADTAGTGAPRDRFVGIAKLPGFYAPDETGNMVDMSGVAAFCAPNTDGQSIRGEEAERHADSTHMKREADETGTTLCIVGFNAGDQYDSLTDERLCEEIAHIAATWYWPAIMEGKLKLAVRHGTTEILVEPDERHDLTHYIEAWDNAVDVPNDNTETCLVTVPKTPRGDPETQAEFRVSCVAMNNGVHAHADEVLSYKPRPNTVALIRGAGMVVKYLEHIPSTLEPQPYQGVCRAGEALADDSTVDPSYTRLEDLLSASEPPAHDDWRAAEIDSKHWPHAKARIGDILRDIKASVDQLMGTPRETTSGEALKELSHRFRFGGTEGPQKRQNLLSLNKISENAGEFKIALDWVKEENRCDAGQINLKLSAAMKDPAAGHPGDTPGEPAAIVEVQINKQTQTLRPIGKKGTQYKVSFQLEDHPLPVILMIQSESPYSTPGEPGYYALKVAANYEGDPR